MNDELIYVESDEEITAIIDRLHTTGGAPVRLVVPKGALVLQSLVSLKLLKREADKLDKPIALVSQDPIALHLGEQADITVFAKPKDRDPVFRSRGTAHAVKTYHQERAAKQEDDESTATVHQPKEQPATKSHRGEIEEAPGGIRVHYYEDRAAEFDPDQPPAAVPETSEDAADMPVEEIALPALAATHRSVDHLIRPRRRAGGWRRAGIIFLTLVLIAATGYILFIELAPRATVAVTFSTQPLDQTVKVTASTKASSVDPAAGTIPAQTFQASVEADKTIPATGTKDAGTKATATLNLFNYWDSTPQVLPAGTQFVASDGTTFISAAAATIPGAQTTLTQGQVLTTPGKTTVDITATANGSASNGKTGKFTIPSIPAVRQSKIYGEPVAPTAGGVSKQVTVVSQTDLDNLKQSVETALSASAKTQLAQKATGERIVDEAIQLSNENDQFSATVGDQADTLKLTATATATGLAFKDSDLNQAAVAVLGRAIPSARTLILRDSDTVAVKGEQLDTTAGTVIIDAHFVTRTALIVDPNSLINQVIGQSIGAAKQLLQQSPEVTNVAISSRPSWLKTMPRRASQIKLVVSYQ